MSSYALITGASKGIGYELTQLIATDNYNLVLVARSGNKLKEIKSSLEKRYDITVHTIIKDLTQATSSKEIYEELQERDINIDVLVNNAGIGDFGAFMNSSWDRNEKMIQLNVSTLVHLTHLFLPGMVKRGKGKILNVASTAAFQPGPLMAVYYATKSFVLSFSEGIAEELRNTGVTVTTLCPGPTSTKFVETADMEDSQLFDNMAVMEPEQVAKSGWNGLKKGKTIVIPGWINKMLVQSIRFTPRAIIRRLVKRLQKSK